MPRAEQHMWMKPAYADATSESAWTLKTSDEKAQALRGRALKLCQDAGIRKHVERWPLAHFARALDRFAPAP